MFLSAIILFTFIANVYPNEFNIIVNIITEELNILKDFLQPKMVSLCYYLLYQYSKIQLYTLNVTNWMKPYIYLLCSTINSYFHTPRIVFEFYTQGKFAKNIIRVDDSKDILINNAKWCDDYELIKYCNEYDFYIVSDNTNYSTSINKIHYYNFTDFVYQESNIKFLSIELTYNGNVYPINLQGDKYNHYIVNNVINDQFFRYYLLNILLIQIEDPFDYTVQLLDHNANFISLLPHQSLLIKEDDYEVLSKELEGQEETKIEGQETKIEGQETKIEGQEVENTIKTRDSLDENLDGFINLSAAEM
jgi:hypothetical protein